MVDNIQIKYKDPNEVLIYTVDWTDRLATGETISTSNFTVDSGITNDSDSNGDTSTSITLSGGTVKNSYTILNRITTSTGQTIDYTFRIGVREK